MGPYGRASREFNGVTGMLERFDNGLIPKPLQNFNQLDEDTLAAGSPPLPARLRTRGPLVPRSRESLARER